MAPEDSHVSVTAWQCGHRAKEVTDTVGLGGEGPGSRLPACTDTGVDVGCVGGGGRGLIFPRDRFAAGNRGAVLACACPVLLVCIGGGACQYSQRP